MHAYNHQALFHHSSPFPTILPRLLYHAADLFSRAACGDPEAMDRLPTPLYDILRLWDIEGSRPSRDWLRDSCPADALPSWSLFGELPMSLFAAGLSTRFGFPSPHLLSPPPPTPPCAPWRVRWLLSQLFAEPPRSPLLWLDVNFSQADVLKLSADLRINTSFLVNLDWPPLDLASSWISILTQFESVADPDPDRVAFLRLFGVRAYFLAYPSLQHKADIEDTAILNHFQTQLGLPDPRWLLTSPSSSLKLSILGTSGLRSEQMWSSTFALSPQHYLWLPRVNMLVISDLSDAIAFQSWLMLLRLSSTNILILESLHHGLFDPYCQQANFLWLDSEEACHQAYSLMHITP